MNDKNLERQIKIDEGLDNLAMYLDGIFRVPGTTWRFGLDSLIGLIPNVGDTLTMFPSFYILLAGVRYGVPKITLLRMAFNIGLDYVVGMVPRETMVPARLRSPPNETRADSSPSS